MLRPVQRLRLPAPDPDQPDELIEYAWHGPPPDAAPTLVLLHEGLGCAALWRDLPEELARRTGLSVLVPSRAGYGGSSPVPPVGRPVSYLRHEGERSLGRLLDALGVRRAVLFGHSDGASIAIVHAAQPAARPRLAALVLEAPHLFVEDLTIASIERARDAYRSGDLRARLERWHGGNVDGAFLGWNGMWLDPAFRAFNIEAEAARIEVPLLCIQGLDDEYGTTAQVEALAARARGPVETLLLPGCGHSPHRDQREPVVEAVCRFLGHHLGDARV